MLNLETSSGFSDISRNLITYVIYTSLIPLLIAGFGKFCQCFFEHFANLIDKIKKIVFKSAVITITQTLRLSLQRFLHDGDEELNGELILSVLDFVSQKECICNDINLNLKSGNENYGKRAIERLLNRYTHTIPNGEFICDDIIIKYWKNVNQQKEANTSIIYNMKLKSYKKNINELKLFVDDCYKKYIKTRYDEYKNYDTCIIYMPIIDSDFYTCYKIPIDKWFTSFDDVFFPEKDLLLKMLDDLDNGKLMFY